MVESAEIFGPANVIPNFVGGVEMNRNYGFSEVEPAIDSTREGLDFFSCPKVSCHASLLGALSLMLSWGLNRHLHWITSVGFCKNLNLVLIVTN